MRPSPYRVVRGYLSGTALVALPLVIALSPVSSFATPIGGPTELLAFNSDPALTRAELDRLRGGFFLANGNMINFGISVSQYVNNQLANSISLKVDNNFTLTQTGPTGTTSVFSTPQGAIHSLSFTSSNSGPMTASFTPPSGGNGSPTMPNNISGSQNGVTNTPNTNNISHLATTTVTPTVSNTNLVTTNTKTPNAILNSTPTSITITPSGLNATLSAVANSGLTNLGVTINNGAIQSVIQNAANNQAFQSVTTLNLTTQGFASTLHNVATMSNIAGVIQSNALLMHH
jgi:hypothetical protein